MISWAASDGRGFRAEEVVPAASTIKPFVVSAFWRSGLDPGGSGWSRPWCGGG